MGLAFSDNFFYVLDEAQASGERYMSTFADANAEIRRPVLRPIIATWQRATSAVSVRFIVSGTGCSLDLFKTVLASSVGKTSGKWTVVQKIGDFTCRDLQESYISRYVPLAFLSSQMGSALVSRMYEWLRRR